jgi:ATP-binding cassette, subfamily B, bacterial
VKLLPRFYDPTKGAVLVDGVDLRACDLDEWRSMLGYVPQEPMLFGASIADNIRFGRPSASLDEVHRAAELVGADTFIMEFPDGYDTFVSARGKSLAAGQRQLIALARAALVRPRLLLLDEATATLDLATEATVQRALTVLAEGATTVVVAHRLDTARRADRVVVIDDGLIVDGAYARLWTLAGSGGALPPM